MPSFTPAFAVLAGRLASVHACLCDVGGAVGLGSCLALRCWRGGWPRLILPLRFWRGGWPQFMPAFATLAGRLASVHVWLCGAGEAGGLGSSCLCGSGGAAGLRLILPLRFWRGVLPSFTPDFAVLLRCFAFVHACFFSFVRKKETACDALRSYSAGSRSPLVRSRGVGAVICLCGFTSGLCVFLWRSRRVTGRRGTRGTGRRRGLCASLRGRIGLDMLSAGSTLGLRAPNLRQRVFDSLDSLHAAAGLCWRKYASLQKAPTLRSAHPRSQSPGTRKDPPGSNLWPGGSGCIEMLSTRTIGDLPDSDLWSGMSCITARQQASAGTAHPPACSAWRSARRGLWWRSPRPRWPDRARPRRSCPRPGRSQSPR